MSFVYPHTFFLTIIWLQYTNIIPHAVSYFILHDILHVDLDMQRKIVMINSQVMNIAVVPKSYIIVIVLLASL